MFGFNGGGGGGGKVITGGGDGAAGCFVSITATSLVSILSTRLVGAGSRMNCLGCSSSDPVDFNEPLLEEVFNEALLDDDSNDPLPEELLLEMLAALLVTLKVWDGSSGD